MFTETTMNTAFSKVISKLSPHAARALAEAPALQAIIQAADRTHVDERKELVARITDASRRFGPDSTKAAKVRDAATARRKLAEAALDAARRAEEGATQYALAIGQAGEAEVSGAEAELRRSADPRIGRVIIALQSLHSEVGLRLEFQIVSDPANDSKFMTTSNDSELQALRRKISGAIGTCNAMLLAAQASSDIEAALRRMLGDLAPALRKLRVEPTFMNDDGTIRRGIA